MEKKNLFMATLLFHMLKKCQVFKKNPIYVCVCMYVYNQFSMLDVKLVTRRKASQKFRGRVLGAFQVFEFLWCFTVPCSCFL